MRVDRAKARPALFWLFLGGFCWVLGDLFQQYAAKYIGIGRGIPLSNTNQLWGLAWGALVFGELAGQSSSAQIMIVTGSVVMIFGALAISTAVAPASEEASRQKAVERECHRYGLDLEQTTLALTGEDSLAARAARRRWWDVLIVAAAVGPRRFFPERKTAAHRAPASLLKLVASAPVLCRGIFCSGGL